MRPGKVANCPAILMSLLIKVPFKSAVVGCASERNGQTSFLRGVFIMAEGYGDFCGKFEMRHLGKRLLYRASKNGSS